MNNNKNDNLNIIGYAVGVFDLFHYGHKNLILESIKKWEDLYSDLLVKPIKWEDGFVIPPTEPGLGIELNEDVANKYPYKGNELHLEMKGN